MADLFKLVKAAEDIQAVAEGAVKAFKSIVAEIDLAALEQTSPEKAASLRARGEALLDELRELAPD